MRRNVTIVSFTLILFSLLFQVTAAPDPNFHIYLLFGQSNMAGPCNNDNATAEARDPQPADCDTSSRVKVLAWGDYARASKPCGFNMNRTHDVWYTAYPPYHNQHEGLGPADYFGKALLDSIRKDISIGFVPCALSGQKIEVFMKGKNAPIDEHTQPTIGTNQKLQSGAYEWMVKRAKLAQEKGVIKGILLHQGEANSSEGDAWVTKVKTIHKDLMADLKLENVPFIAGELIQDPVADANAKNLNPFVNKLPDQLPNCGVASSKDLKMRSGDTWKLHFSCSGIRELGRRYANAFLKLSSHEFVPRINDTIPVAIAPRSTTTAMPNNLGTDATIYSLDGRAVKVTNNNGIANCMKMKTPGVYIVIDKAHTRGRTAMVPFIQN